MCFASKICVSEASKEEIWHLISPPDESYLTVMSLAFFLEQTPDCETFLSFRNLSPVNISAWQLVDFEIFKGKYLHCTVKHLKVV